MKSIGTRMKGNYEDRYRVKLTRRMPVVLRLDGKAFHTLTRHCEKPFDLGFAEKMHLTAFRLCGDIQGAKCAYIQSDEISILVTDFDTLQTEAWFDYNLQKMVSVAASTASAFFNTLWPGRNRAVFDCRAFNVPKEEVTNYFIWRQQDWIRNSLQMLARAHFSHKKLHKKNSSDMHEMLHEIGVNWADLDMRWKNGLFLFKHEDWSVTTELILTQDRNPVERCLIENDLCNPSASTG